MFILNGRIGSDYTTPNLTYKERSTADYFLASSSIFENLYDFHVMEYCCLFSGAHCAVTLTLNLNRYSKPVNVINENIERPIFWQSDKSKIFQENFDIVQVSAMKLNQLIEKDHLTENHINEIVGNKDSLFETCSKESFGSKTVKKDNKYSNLSSWFNRPYINARNIYPETRKIYNKYKTVYHKNNLKIVSKNYKNTL